MQATIKAVTVSVNYIERKKWSVKLLSVETRKNGTLYWRVRATVATSDPTELLYRKAVLVAAKHRVPFIYNIRHGMNITEEEKDLLEKYDVVVS